MDQPTARVRVDESLRFLLPGGSRDGDLTVPVDDASTLVHIIESLGVPRTEIGEVRVAGRPSPLQSRPGAGDLIEVLPVRRPQRLADPRFVLDVHLGALARRMRMLGIDTAYRNDASDPELVEEANAQGRFLLTQDRGLLRRRALTAGGYVRGSRPDDQLVDALTDLKQDVGDGLQHVGHAGDRSTLPPLGVGHVGESRFRMLMNMSADGARTTRQRHMGSNRHSPEGIQPSLLLLFHGTLLLKPRLTS